MIQEYLNTRDVSQLLGLSVSTLKRLRKEPNGIPWTKIGSQVRYHIHDVRDWMRSNRSRCKRDVDMSGVHTFEEGGL